MGGGLAGEVSGVELRDGGVEVVQVENDSCRSPFVGVDLNDVEGDYVERISSLTLARASDTAEDEVAHRGSR